MTDNALRIGRVVHYVSLGSADGYYPSACRAADVTETDVDHEIAGLFIKNPEGVHFHSLAKGGVSEDPDGAPGTFHWPRQCPRDM